MKIKQGYLLRNMTTKHFIMPSSSGTVEYQRMFSLNESGAFLWRELEKGATREELLSALLREYDVEESEALADIEEFLSYLRQGGMLEE